MNIPDWKIYYGNNSTFDNFNGPPEAAPSTGVIAIACYDCDSRRRILSQKDFYWWVDGWVPSWVAGDQYGMLQYMMQPGLKIIKFGTSVDDRVWREIIASANDLPLELGDIKPLKA